MTFLIHFKNHSTCLKEPRCGLVLLHASVSAPNIRQQAEMVERAKLIRMWRGKRIFQGVKLNWKFNMLLKQSINSASNPLVYHSSIAASHLFLFDNLSSTTTHQNVAQRSPWRCYIRHSRLSLFTSCQPQDNL